MFARTIAIECSDKKTSSLFFDQIIPLASADDVPKEIMFEKPADEILPVPLEEILKKTKATDLDVDVMHPYLLNLWAYRIQNQLAIGGLPSVPFYYESELFNKLQPKGDHDAIELTLSNIGVINDYELEWEQVIEIRNDRDSAVKLRRLRMFMTEKYKNKSASYVRDSLYTMIFDYEQACRKHGLSLTMSTISKILDSKSLLGILGISAAGILTGSAAVVTASVIGGAAIEIGKAAIHIAEKKLEFRSYRDSSEIAYLMAIREKTANK